MIANYPLSSVLPVFASCSDRFVLGGYGRGGTTMDEMLDLAAKVKGLDGLELVGGWHVNDQNVKEVGKKLQDRGYKITMLFPDLWTQAKWGRGSFGATDPKTRQAAIDEVKKCIDWAAELGVPGVGVWGGQDGYDYSFQADYTEARKWMRECLAAMAKHNNKVKVLVEYKAKEPRMKCFLSNAATCLLLLEGIDNTGMLLDVGHSLVAGENMAEVVALLASHGKLDYFHLNDNYRSWDDDMLVSSVHIVETLELLYWIKRVGYKGWLSLDMFPYREDKVQAAVQSIKWLEALFAAIDRVGMDKIDKVIKENEGAQAVGLVREALTGR